jgi:peptidoglycan hydrolase-like protein with peptidoglycan-binding domain
MTVEAMSSLPLQAGGALAAAAGRTALWVISAYMRQPLRNTAIVALIGFSTLAGANALYKQHHHPAPLFGSFADNPAPVLKKIAPVMPAERPAKLAAPETTGSVDEPVTTPEPQTVTNADVTQMQQKLASLGLYNGAADGLFGPKTARALKAFEASVGRPQRGLLTPQIVAMIEQAPMPAPIVPAASPQAAPAAALPTAAPPAQAQVQVAASPSPVAQALPPVTAPAAITSTPAQSTPVQSAPVQVASISPLKPLPAPAPLDPAHPLTRHGQPPVAAPAVASTDAPASADMISVDDSAASTDVADTTETMPMNSLPAPAKRVVPTIAVHAQPAPEASADTAQAMPGAIAPADAKDASTDPTIVGEVQRGLNSLGFLHQQVDGVAGEATAKAIRNFEVYFNYNVTGRVTRDLVKLLQQNGAVI